MDERVTAERWARIEALLDQALTLPPAQRAEFLLRRTGDDKELRGEVQSLLDQALTRGDILDRPAVAGIERYAPAASLAGGARVGAWRVLEPVGRGGMGEVYRAERADGQFQQQAALKLIRREAIDQLDRFHDERRMLARLDHPGIARLFDGGVTEDGRPYMAMEWVQGQAITAWCRELGADLAQRLDVFVQVCEAVAYAHRNLLVHRDLKPGNVLVTAEGRSKLLDFGVAKLLSPSDLTLHTEAPVTPAYAAPEQLTQTAVTTAADVFALGLLLFELLTGERPWYRPQMSLVALIEKLLHESAPAPSAAAAKLPAPPLPPRLLRGDLDAIVAKALRKEPEHRYQTVAEFAADLNRHLQGKAIAAREGARLYVFGRFLRRYRWAVAGVSALILSLAAGVAGVAWQARRAEMQADRATAVQDFLIDVFRASDPRIASDKPRGQITAKELLDLNAPRIAQEFADDPDTQIELLGVTASIYRELEDRPQYEALHRRKIELARRRHGDLHPIVLQGMLDEAQDANGNRQEYAEALAALTRADPLLRRAGLDRSALRARWWLLRSEALSADATAQPERAAALDQAIALYRAVAPADPGLVTALYGRGDLYFSGGKLEQAEQEYLQAIGLAEQLPERDDAELQSVYGGLAEVRDQQGNFDGAEAAHERVADIARRTHGEQHSTYWVPAASYFQMLHRQGKTETAHAQFQRLFRHIPPRWDTNNYDEYARELYATCLAAEGRSSEAIPLLEAAQRVYLEKPGTEYDLRRVRIYLGDAYLRAGRLDAARPILKAAVDEYVARNPPDDRRVLLSRERWGRLLLMQNDLAGAEAQFREVLAQAHGRRFASIALAQGGVARVALARKDLSAALDFSRMAVDTFQQVTGSRDVRTGPYLWLIRSEALRLSGDPAGAQEWAGRALEASRRYDHPSAPSLAEAEAAVLRARTPY